MSNFGRFNTKNHRNFSTLITAYRDRQLLTFLVALPIFLGFVASWFGLGVFKPWPHRFAAIPYWSIGMLLLFNISFAVFTGLQLILNRRHIATPKLMPVAASGMIGVIFYRPAAILHSHIYAALAGYQKSAIQSLIPNDLAIFLKWQTDHIPFMIIWVVGIWLLTKDQSATLITETDKFGSLFQKIDPDQLVSVSADGHYIRVKTTDDELRLMYKFSQALQRLQDHKGIQIHRSHWVNPMHILSVNDNDTPTGVVLKSGEHLPVSRTYCEQLSKTLRGCGFWLAAG